MNRDFFFVTDILSNSTKSYVRNVIWWVSVHFDYHHNAFHYVWLIKWFMMSHAELNMSTHVQYSQGFPRHNHTHVHRFYKQVCIQTQISLWLFSYVIFKRNAGAHKGNLYIFRVRKLLFWKDNNNSNYYNFSAQISFLYCSFIRCETVNVPVYTKNIPLVAIVFNILSN